MLRQFARSVALLGIVALLGSCGPSQPVLQVFVWSEYVDPQIFAEFERRFHCRVIVDYYEDVDIMTAKLAAGGTSLYDVVVPSDNTLPVLIKRGLVAPLRPENIPNLKHLDPQFTQLPFDPGNQYGVPCDWGVTGIYSRLTKGQTVEETWGLIFNPAQQPGPFMLLEDARSCIGAALRYKGHSLNSIDPKELAEARDLLIDAKKRSVGFEGGTGAKNSVLAKRTVLAMAYNGDAARGRNEDPETKFFIPKEGSQIWLDLLSIPAKAPHRALAEQFINFVLDPQISAQFANFAQLATPNKAAQQFVRPTDLQNPTIYPPPEVMNRLEYARDLGDKSILYDQLWTEIKSR